MDCFLSSRQVSVESVATRVIPGIDHVGARMTLEPVNNDTLGVRLELPTHIGAEALAATAGENRQQRSTVVVGNHQRNGTIEVGRSGTTDHQHISRRQVRRWYQLEVPPALAPHRATGSVLAPSAVFLDPKAGRRTSMPSSVVVWTQIGTRETGASVGSPRPSKGDDELEPIG